MQNHLRQENDALLYERYQPGFIDAFFESRHYPTQTIEEWTSAEGVDRFGGSQIYKPLNVNVCISGPSDNLFSVDCTKMDWHPKLVRAVKSACVQAKIATDADQFALSDVCGTIISSDISASALKAAGVIYPVINGVRSTRSPLVGSEIQALTPVTHQANRNGQLLEWSRNVCGKAASIITAAVGSSVHAADVDQRLFSDDVRKQIVQLVAQNLPAVADTFLDDGADHGPVSQAVAEKILETVESIYQKRAKDVTDFFAHQAAIASSAGNQLSPQTSDKRSMFSQSVKDERVKTEQQVRQSAISSRIGILYPTQPALHRDILAPLATSDVTHEMIGHCLCSPCHGQRKHRHRHGEGRVRNRRGGNGAFINAPLPAPAVTATAAAKEQNHLAAFKHLLTESEYLRAIGVKHALEGIPASPGFEPFSRRERKAPESSSRPLIGDEAASVNFSAPRKAFVVPEPSAATATETERKMPSLETSVSRQQQRSMPGLETTAIARQFQQQQQQQISAPVAQERRMPGLEMPATTAATAATVNIVGKARIRHTESNSSSNNNELPQIRL